MMTARYQDGFSLIELLTVCLIIGILSAVALPSFLNLTGSARDALAKSNAKSLSSLVEACFAGNEDYALCDAEDELEGVAEAGLEWGNKPGQIRITAADEATYRIVSRSATGTNFVYRRMADGTQKRTCNSKGEGGCSGSGDW